MANVLLPDVGLSSVKIMCPSPATGTSTGTFPVVETPLYVAVNEAAEPAVETIATKAVLAPDGAVAEKEAEVDLDAVSNAIAMYYGSWNVNPTISPFGLVVLTASTSILNKSAVATSSFAPFITAGVAAVAVSVSVESIVNFVERISTASVTFAICISVVPVVPAVITFAYAPTRLYPFKDAGTLKYALPSPVVTSVAYSITVICTSLLP